MRDFFHYLLINKKPILTPDCNISLDCNDLDDPDSGRDESGVMHRIVLRRKVKSISLSYSVLSDVEYRYMESLFDGLDEFTVEYLDRNGLIAEFTAYRSKHSITFHNMNTGVYKNYKFNLIEC